MKVEELHSARVQAEKALGYSISDQDYDEVLRYSIRKLSYIKKDESYLPLLLESEIRDFCARRAINAASQIMRGMRECAASV